MPVPGLPASRLAELVDLAQEGIVGFLARACTQEPEEGMAIQTPANIKSPPRFTQMCQMA